MVFRDLKILKLKHGGLVKRNTDGHLEHFGAKVVSSVN